MVNRALILGSKIKCIILLYQWFQLGFMYPIKGPNGVGVLWSMGGAHRMCRICCRRSMSEKVWEMMSYMFNNFPCYLVNMP